MSSSHGTGGLADSVDIIEEAAPDAEISDNIFDCYEEDASSSQGEIQSWVERTGVLKLLSVRVENSTE